MSLFLRSPRTRQPQGLVRARDDVALLWSGSFPDVVHGSLYSGKLTVQGSPEPALSVSGKARSSNSYGGNNRYTGPTYNPSGLNWAGVTVVAKVRYTPQAGDQYPAVVSLMPPGEYYGGFNLSIETGSGVRVIYFRAGNSGTQLSLTAYGDAPKASEIPNVLGELTLVASWDRATIRLLVIKQDGTVAFNSSPHAFGWSASNALLAFLGYERTGYRTLPHPTYLIGVLPRGSSELEMRSLAANPWQLFKPVSRSLWIPGTVSGGSSHTLTGANSAQTASSGAGAIAQTHLLTGAGSSQTAVSGTGAIIAGAVHVLAAADASQSATSSAAAITQRHTLISAPSVQDSVAGASAIVQRHMLVASACSQAAVSGVGALGGSSIVVEAPPGSATRPSRLQVSNRAPRYQTGARHAR